MQAFIGKKRKKKNQSIQIFQVNNAVLDILYALKIKIKKMNSTTEQNKEKSCKCLYRKKWLYRRTSKPYLFSYSVSVCITSIIK